MEGVAPGLAARHEASAVGGEEAGRRFRSVGLLGLLVVLLVGAQSVIRVPVERVELAWSMSTVFQVGSLDGPDALGQVAALAFGPAGDLFVLDGSFAQVVVFDTLGHVMRRFGARGDGPAELREPVGWTVDPGGHVWVGDAGSRSLKVFGPEGAHLRTVSFRDRPVPDLRTLTSGEAGAVLVLERPRDAKDKTIALLRVTEDGDIREMRRVSVAFVPRMVRSGRRSFRFIWAPVFTPRTRLAALPDGGWVTAEDATYTLSLVTASGSRGTVRADVSRARVTSTCRS